MMVVEGEARAEETRSGWYEYLGSGLPSGLYLSLWVRAQRAAPFPRGVCCIKEAPVAVERSHCSTQAELIWMECSRVLAKRMGNWWEIMKMDVKWHVSSNPWGNPCWKNTALCFLTNKGCWRSHEKQISRCLQTESPYRDWTSWLFTRQCFD